MSEFKEQPPDLPRSPDRPDPGSSEADSSAEQESKSPDNVPRERDADTTTDRSEAAGTEAESWGATDGGEQAEALAKLNDEPLPEASTPSEPSGAATEAENYSLDQGRPDTREASAAETAEEAAQPHVEAEGTGHAADETQAVMKLDDEPLPEVTVGRTDIPSQYPADYVPSDAALPTTEMPHTPPEGWAEDVNPDRNAAGRDNNCGECARASDANWLGSPSVAAAMKNPDAPGEPINRMSDWAGIQPQSSSIDDIGHRLREQGPGGSAVVGCDWHGGGGHWFNAVNDAGVVKAVDGQTGEIEPWPPSHDGLGFDAGDMQQVDAIVIDSDGRPVQW